MSLKNEWIFAKRVSDEEVVLTKVSKVVSG